MKQLKKTLLTLVALLALTTGAWAQSTLDVVEFEVPAEWETKNSNMTAADLPGFKTSTLDEAKAWTGAPEEGFALLIYAFDGEEACFVPFANGKAGTEGKASYPKNQIFGTKSVIKYFYTTGPASSATAVDIAWDKTTKTGTFTQPAGNVTVSVDYYPQAALTEAPTAINDVPATTDGAIVKAGTVANIGTTETAQGTVMYYVSQTALDDDALLALDADQWKADVPTAESLAEGQAYVYYYVRGNDSDTDEENFNDGDILAANALNVTIAAEPTYAVTFADGTQDADKWTVKAGTDGSFQSLPLEGVKAGTKVKLKYDGDRSMLKGVTAVKKAAAGIVNPVVGQVIGSDGKNYDANATLPDGVTAVAVIAYVGSETGDDTYKNGLAIALADESNSNWSTAKSTCEGKSAVSGAAWLLPSQKQWKTMFKANGGNEGSYSGLNTAIGTAGGTALQVNERYWSSSELDADFAWVLVLGENSAGWDGAPEDLGHQVRACLAF